MSDHITDDDIGELIGYPDDYSPDERKYDEFKAKQRKIVTDASKERKQREKELREQLEKDYWEEYDWIADVDHDWDREPNENEINEIKEIKEE